MSELRAVDASTPRTPEGGGAVMPHYCAAFFTCRGTCPGTHAAARAPLRPGASHPALPSARPSPSNRKPHRERTPRLLLHQMREAWNGPTSLPSQRPSRK